ncbi:MAG: hypothetical protein B1H06_00310 [Candidatus Cloacimonas sp. 4484_143]|nr:MAG: hypothetical protein B1H06_00310 [Candidatus Cloacimonas sp. 4484_143]RLC52924.1 MAG: hypothetical protein DRI23_01665 [Candidatus Cloacimonadota bacterium]RLC58025.1 MAG: hypothetical protein DRH89_02075 [Candidatus Cloacimonadota bacterium]
MRSEKHLGGFKYRNRRNVNQLGKNSLLGTIITGIAGVVIKDLTNENSKIKKLFSKVIHPKQIEDKQGEKKVIEAEYSVINNEKK